MALYRPENILKNDQSVYCTKSANCNILLRHRGDTTFSLERLVIKAPERGFTAPVQEGMIFVSMTSDSLLSRTAQWQIKYPPQASLRSPDPNEELSLLESLRDPVVQRAASRQQLRQQYRERRQAQLTSRIQESNEERMTRQWYRRHRSFHPMRIPSSFDLENCDPPFRDLPQRDEDPASANAPTSAPTTAPTPPPFIVTTEYDESSSDADEASSNPAIMADRIRRDSRWRANSEEEDEDLAAMNVFWDQRHENRQLGGIGYIRANRASSPTQVQASTGDLLAPHARFFIEKDKSKISVRFDPPVSGKFILLKLWSPQEKGNIDIQNVTAHGFSGPRYFPAVHMR